MVDVNNNGIPDDEETRAYKSRAVNAKFGQQVCYGLGAATVFGLVSAAAKLLFDAAFPAAGTAATAVAATGGTLLPLMGLAGLAVLGIGLLYMSAKLLSENTVADQELQAKQISAATRGKAPKVDPIGEERPVEFPSTTTLPDKQKDTPQTTIRGDKILDSMERLRATKAANQNEPNSSWQDKTTASSSEEKVRA